MFMVMICLGDEDDEACNGLIRLLSVLLSTEKSAEDKKRILETEFGIAMTKELGKEVRDMDYADYVEAKGIRKGMKKGIEKGEALLSSLMKRLFAEGRDEDAMLALEDENLRKKLYKEYGIVTKWVESCTLIF